MGKPKGNKRGPRMEEKKEFQEELIQLDRVTRVVKGGRRLRFRATVTIGNRKGKIGLGIGKSAEVVEAIKKAVSMAKKALLEVPIYRETIPHRTQAKFKASKVLLIPAGPGTGIIAGSGARKIIELSGIKNILSKNLGSSNRVNNAKATFKALEMLRKRQEPQKKEESPTPPEQESTKKAESPIQT